MSKSFDEIILDDRTVFEEKADMDILKIEYMYMSDHWDMCEKDIQKTKGIKGAIKQFILQLENMLTRHFAVQQTGLNYCNLRFSQQLICVLQELDMQNRELQMKYDNLEKEFAELKKRECVE